VSADGFESSLESIEELLNVAMRGADQAFEGSASRQGPSVASLLGAAEQRVQIADGARMVPHIKLFCERMMVDTDRGFVERDLPALQLRFRYPEFDVRSSDARERFFAANQSGMYARGRDYAREAQVRQLLESFGAVDLRCLEEFGCAPGTEADYLVHLNDDVHTYCAFTSHALKQLRHLGWSYEIAADYPYQVIEQEPSWYATVLPNDGKPDWFSLQLGVEIDGHRLNLMPVLLELIEDASGQLDLQILARRSRRFFALPLGGHQYLPVPNERMQTLLRVVVELYRGEGLDRGGLPFPRLRAGALIDLNDSFKRDATELQWDGDAFLRDYGEQLATVSVVDPEQVAAALQASLRPYQQQGLSWLQHLRAHGLGGVLADDMGLGKTLQTIAHFVAEKQSGRADLPSLVITQTSLVGNWQREFTKFAPHLRVVVYHGPERAKLHGEITQADVVISSYPLLVREEERWLQQEFHVAVLDEAQAIKNARSQAHRAARQLRARHRVCLSGTPVENSLSELWSLFDFVMPGYLGSETRFRHYYLLPIERQGDETRLAALRSQVAPYILRRMKDQVAKELPPKTEIVKPVEITGKQRELYESIRMSVHSDVRKAIRKKGFDASTLNILDGLMKLRQLCCDPRIVKVEAARFVRESAKLNALMEMLSAQLADGRRVLIFSQFTSMLGLISQSLNERAISHVSLTGSTTDRQKPVDAFENREVDVFLISLKAGGTGLNLVSADTVIHYDPWWNPAAQSQATDRAYRIGQKRPVFVYNLIIAGSVEERMLQLQSRKRQLAESILSAGDAEAPRWTEHEVDVLFAALPDAS